MQLDELTKERLLLLCAYMESLPQEADEHFSMRRFADHKNKGHKHVIPAAPKQSDLLTCGTSACALGWGATMPELQKLGLHFILREWGWSVEGHEEVFPGLDGDIEDERGTRWGLLFEGFNNDETPRQWAARARELIEEWSQPHAFTPSDDF